MEKIKKPEDIYRELFIEINIKASSNPDFCYYSLLSDSLIDKEYIQKFKICYQDKLLVFYKGKLIQELKDWDLIDFLRYKNFVSIHNKNFEKDGFENFLVSLKRNNDLREEFISDVIKSPFCNLRDLEYLYGRKELTKKLSNNSIEYSKFEIHELDEYKDFICWYHVLQNRKDINSEFLSRYRIQIRKFIHNKFPNSIYQEMKYISYWLCLNRNSDWEKIERYLRVYNYYKDLPKDCITQLTINISFPKDYYFDYFINDTNPFEKFNKNIDLTQLKYNIFLPTEIIQLFIEEAIDKKETSHCFTEYYNLTIQQFLQLLSLSPKIFSKQNFKFKTFGVYQYSKYYDIIKRNPIIMEKFGNMLSDSQNGIQEFYDDYNKI